ncbi:MAG: glycosyltransferase family 2 protein [Nitrosotalea sp.]
MPLVSIIIVNYNGKKHLEDCLKSLACVTYNNVELILVDNNSVDDSVIFVKSNYPNVQLIKLDENYGFAKPNNMGAANAHGQYLLFLNNDTMVTPNFVTELVNIMTAKPEIAICQSLLLKPNGGIDSSGDFVDIFGRAYSSRIECKDIRYILSARGAALLIKKEVFWDLGGFDEKYFVSFEDVDLGWRAWIFGYKVVLVPSSVVYHKGGQTIREMDSIIRVHGVKNTLLLRLTNFEIIYAIRSIATLFFVTFMRKTFGISIIQDPEEGPPLPSLKTTLKGIVWVLKNVKYIGNKRKQINRRRIRSTRDLIGIGVITN